MIELIFNLDDLTPLWSRVANGLDEKTKLHGSLGDLIAQVQAGETLLAHAAGTRGLTRIEPRTYR